MRRMFRGWRIGDALTDIVVLAFAGAATYVAQLFDRHISAALMLQLGIIFVGSRSGLKVGLAAALGCSILYNFFLSEPVFRFGMTSLDEAVPLIAFNVSALLTGALAGRLKDVAKTARQAEQRSELLLQVSDPLHLAMTLPDVDRLARRALPFQQIEDFELYHLDNDTLTPVTPPGHALDLVARLLDQGAEHLEARGWSVHRLSGASVAGGAIAFRLRPGSVRDAIGEGGLVHICSATFKVRAARRSG